ncbi:MAG: hypothetical protein AB8B99_14335 [Phormidesmis sp.]
MSDTHIPSVRDRTGGIDRTDKDHMSCSARVEFTETEFEILNSDRCALFTQLAFSGPGSECYGYDGDGYLICNRTDFLDGGLISAEEIAAVGGEEPDSFDGNVFESDSKINSESNDPDEEWIDDDPDEEEL